LAAHLVDPAFSACTGRVIFAGGSEAAVIDPPRLLESIRVDEQTSAVALERFSERALVPAEAAQVCGGGSNPRFASTDGEGAAGDLPPAEVRSCVIVTDRPDLGTSLTEALGARSVRCHIVEAGDETSFAGAADALATAVDRGGPTDAVVIARRRGSPVDGPSTPWRRVLAEHDGIVDDVLADAAWSRAVADHAARAERSVRLLTLTDAATAGGRSRSQASAQLARAARGATDDRVTAVAVSVEGASDRQVAPIAAHLLCSPTTAALSGAELVAGEGWFGLRSHPRPAGSVALGGTELPVWFDDALREIAGVAPDAT
jgi:hypothetical protein